MKIIKFMFKIAFLLLVFGGILLGYAFKIEPYRIETNSYNLKGSNKEPETSVRIVQLSDIQISRFYTENNLKELIDNVNDLNPDIVVFTGDLYDNYSNYHPDDNAVSILSEITANYGKVAVWGNRDYGGGAEREYDKIMTSVGFILLRNESVQVTVANGKMISIGGVDDALLGEPDMEQTIQTLNQESEYRLLLLHEPDLADEVEEGKVDLILAGHSHGGQVKIPFYRGLTTALAEKYIEGFYDVNDALLYVNTGIGTSHLPIRFMMVPEIAVFDIEI